MSWALKGVEEQKDLQNVDMESLMTEQEKIRIEEIAEQEEIRTRSISHQE